MKNLAENKNEWWPMKQSTVEFHGQLNEKTREISCQRREKSRVRVTCKESRSTVCFEWNSFRGEMLRDTLAKRKRGLAVRLKETRFIANHEELRGVAEKQTARETFTGLFY